MAKEKDPFHNFFPQNHFFIFLNKFYEKSEEIRVKNNFLYKLREKNQQGGHNVPPLIRIGLSELNFDMVFQTPMDSIVSKKFQMTVKQINIQH